MIKRFEQIEQLRMLSELIEKARNCGALESYLLAVQLAELSRHSSFKSSLKYSVYRKEREDLNLLLSSFNTTRYQIKSIEEGKVNKKKLVVKFPKVDDISNGERDVLNFIAQLQLARKRFRKESCILIIDEVFDYLDDANLVALQYYITQLIEDFKNRDKCLYPIILTHLDPEYFQHYFFRKHLLMICYFNRRNTMPASTFIKLVGHRNQPSIKADISKHFFHYHPVDKDLESEFLALSMKKKWGKSHTFYQLVEDEAKKYLNNAQYDSIAVLFWVRIKIEKLALEQLSHAQQSTFLNTKGTKKKLEFSVGQGAVVPESHFLLGIIYNDSLHWDPRRDYETPLISKLENGTIKKLISELYV